MKPLLTKSNVQLKLSSESSAQVYADPRFIIRVINNYISNAIKFSPENGTIYVSTVRIKEMDNFFQEFSVTDQGPGIEPNKWKLLFNAYSQVGNSKLTLPKGTGLGLAISKLIIEAHGGTVGYRPGEKGGSTFFFRLPEHLVR